MPHLTEGAILKKSIEKDTKSSLKKENGFASAQSAPPIGCRKCLVHYVMRQGNWLKWAQLHEKKDVIGLNINCQSDKQ